MEYKLYYLDRWGHVACPDGELCHGKTYEELYENIDEAKAKAKKFVDKYPLMECSIFNDKNDDEIIIRADKEKRDKAWKEENEKNRILFAAYEKKQKRFKYLVITVFIFICVSSFMLLR